MSNTSTNKCRFAISNTCLKIMRRLLIPVFVSVGILLCGCSDRHSSYIPLSPEMLPHLPAERGKYVIATDSLRQIYRELRQMGWGDSWRFYLAFDDDGDAKFSQDSLRVKGTWYDIRWSSRYLYLRLKANKGKERNALILYGTKQRNTGTGFKLVQRGCK